jgi:uncharacterized protein (TIRG00374 family)
LTTSEPGGRIRRLLSTLIGIAVSLLLLWWAVRGVHFSLVAEHLRQADPLVMVIAVVVATLCFFIRAIRWRWLLTADDGEPLALAPLWHAVAIGFMANNLLPLRAGEVIRCYVITRLAPVRFSGAVSSVAVERVLDGLTVVGLLVVALLASNLPPDVALGGVPVARAAAGAAALCVLLLLAAVLVLVRPLWAERAIRVLVPAPRLAERLVGIVEGVRQGLSSLRSPRRLGAAAAWSVIHWLVNGAAFWIAFRAFGIPVGYSGALILQGVLIFGIAVPQAPGFVGVFEASIRAVLALYGIDESLALAYAATYHVTTFIPIILLGVASLLRTSLGFGELRHVAEEPAA